MGFLKTANAVVEKTKLERDDWNQVRKSSSYRKAGFQQRQSSDVDLNEYSPDDYLLTHSTIIASVDTKEVPNIKTGEEIQDGKGREIFRPFNDYRIAQDTEKFINQNCFPSGSMVTMADGSEKPIEEIEEGEEVLTHRGRTKKVTETFEREYEGTVVSVDSIGSPSTITATDEHPFFAFRPEEECVNCEGEIDHHAPCISNLFERNYCSRDCYYDYGKTNEDLLEEKEGKFVEASELKEKFDYLTNPVIEETKEVGLNENKARLVGLFLAEGYYDVDSRDNNARKAPMFAYHQEETGTLARRTLDLMKEEFGVEGKIHHHLNDRGIHVSFPWDEDLVEFFTKWVKGSDATEKKLHGDLLKASKDIQKEVVRGWFEGDGSVFGAGEIDQFRLSGASASRDLINQISLLLTRLGVHSYTQHEESDGRKRENGSVVSDASSTCESWIINVGAAWARDLVKNTVFADDYFRLVEKQGGVQSASDLRFMKGSRLEMLEAAEEEYFEGKVYNIEVEEDHSYVVEGRSVHNCDSWERDLLLQTYDSFIGAENYCFEGSTPVMMEDGSYKSIEDIEEGDKVVTHSGDTREVTHTFEREVDENILEIQVDRYDDPVRVTKNHPFRKIEVEYPEFNHRSSTSESTKQRYRKDQRMKYLRGDSDAKKGFDSELVWEEAGSLKEGDFVVSPEEPSVEARISEEKAKILGHYLAEGCLLSPEDPEGVIITPGVHEDEVVEDLTGCVSAAFPSTEIRVSETDTSTYRVSLRGEEIGEWCKEHGGHLAHRKSLSSEVFQWDRSTLKTILTMWLNGDGDFHKRTSRLRGNTVSEDLVHQMLRICDILGIRSSITKTDRDHIKDNEVDIDGYGEHTISSNHDLWQIHISKEDSEVLLNNALRWDDVDVESSAKSREFSFWEGKRTHRVDSIEEVSHEGKVHNIEVEGDHSYVISPGIAVHNCEHVQIPEKSKGKVIDAVARDLDDTVYIDILVATNRDHNHLVSSIESGEMDTLSMGCSISYSLCTKCGNLAADETDMCPHIRHMKGEYFEDEDGVSRKVAELCFTGDTGVTRSDGTRGRIDSMEVGDEVLTHTGSKKEVTKTYERDYEGPLVEMDILGLPETLQSTPNHPYYVLSQSDTCACGCGESLNHTTDFEKASFSRSYKPGHNPNQKGEHTTEVPDFEFKEARNVREGDMVAMPIPDEVSTPKDVDRERAELLGWFLAEGSFEGGENDDRSSVSFTLDAENEQDVAERISSLLSDCFSPQPDGKRENNVRLLESLREEGPGTVRTFAQRLGESESLVKQAFQRLRDRGLAESRNIRSSEKEKYGARSTNAYLWQPTDKDTTPDDWYNTPCIHLYDRSGEPGKKLVVKYRNQQAADWFYRHSNEYADQKRLSEEAVYWPEDLQRPVLKAYLKGDGTTHEGGTVRHSVSSVSEDLIAQMQIVAARCGFWTRRQVIFGGESSDLSSSRSDESDDLPRDSRGCLPRHELHIQPSEEAQSFFSDSDHDRQISSAWRDHEGYMLYGVRDVSQSPYEGKVYNLEVEDDHSYLAEGRAVHNCGHKSDPDSVNFIEASWVASPAFDGAVMRKILGEDEINENPSVEESLSQKIEQAHSMGNFNTGGSSMDQFLAKSANQEGVREKIRGGLREGVKAALKDKAASSDDILPDQKDDPNDFNSRSHKVNTSEKYSQAWGDGGGQEDQQQQTDDRDLVEKLVDELKGVVFDEAKQELSETIEDHGKFQEFEDNPYSDSTLNNNIQHSRLLTTFKAFDQKYGSHLNNFHKKRDVFLSLWKAGQDGWSSLREADCLDNPSIVSAIYLKDTKMSDRQASLSMEDYQCLAYVGGTQNYRNKEAFLKACTSYLGRQPTKKESKAMIRRAKYLH